MLSENDAREKWCPMTRIMFVQQGGSANRWTFKRPDGEQVGHTKNPPECRCIASGCMMWRWGTELITGGPAYETKPVKDSPGHFDHAPQGYCGLAGKPEAA